MLLTFYVSCHNFFFSSLFCAFVLFSVLKLFTKWICHIQQVQINISAPFTVIPLHGCFIFFVLLLLLPFFRQFSYNCICRFYSIPKWIHQQIEHETRFTTGECNSNRSWSLFEQNQRIFLHLQYYFVWFIYIFFILLSHLKQKRWIKKIALLRFA